MSEVPSFDEWMATGPYAAFVAERRFATGAPARLLLSRQPAGHFPTPPSRDLQVQLIVEGSPLAGLDFGIGRFHHHGTPGSFCVAPAGHGNLFETDDRFAVLIACLPWAETAKVVAAASGGELQDLAALHRSGHADRAVRDLTQLLWRAAADENPVSRLYADGLTQALVAALVRLAQPARPPARSAALPAWRLKRAQAILADRLDEEIELAEVAAAVGLSPFHFARAFKAATGTPPHAWRNGLRIAHAQQLLAGTRRPIADIATACGFCSQAHLTHAFRKATGLTPAAWRRARHG